MGGCQNYGPLLDPYDNTAPNIQGTQKGTIILTTTHITIGLGAEIFASFKSDSVETKFAV